MTILYPVLYILLWLAAVFLTVLKRSSMVVLLWPILLLNPYAWVRSHFSFLPTGLQDLYAVVCLALLIVDLPKMRRNMDPGVLRGAVVLLALMMTAHVLGAIVLIVNNPTFSRMMPVMSISADLRFMLPALMVVVHVRTLAEVRLAIKSFAFAMTGAFMIVVADRYTPIIYELFNHTSYGSTVEDHIRRTTGGFAGPWEVGCLGAMGAVAALALLGAKRSAGSPRLLGPFWVVALFISTFLGTLLSQSRSGMLAWSVGVAGMALFSSWRSRWRLVLPLAAVVVLALTLRFAQSEWESHTVIDVVETRFQSAFADGQMIGTAEARANIWKRQLESLMSGQFTSLELLFGVGGMEGSAMIFRAASHSGFLGPLVYFGIPMGLLLIIRLFWLLWKAVRLGRRTGNPGAAFLVVVMLAAMVGSEFLVSTMSAAVFGFMLTILARVATITVPASGPSRGVPGASPPPVPGRLAVQSSAFETAGSSLTPASRPH